VSATKFNAARRAKLAASGRLPGPFLWGLTGREESSQAYVFTQGKIIFITLPATNEEQAGLIVLPALKDGQSHGRVGQSS